MREHNVEPDTMESLIMVGIMGGARVFSPGTREEDIESFAPHSEASETEQDWDGVEGDEGLLDSRSPEFEHLEKSGTP